MSASSFTDKTEILLPEAQTVQIESVYNMLREALGALHIKTPLISDAYQAFLDTEAIRAQPFNTQREAFGSLTNNDAIPHFQVPIKLFATKPNLEGTEWTKQHHIKSATFVVSFPPFYIVHTPEKRDNCTSLCNHRCGGNNKVSKHLCNYSTWGTN